jgi:preprotein translocase subunit SecA
MIQTLAKKIFGTANERELKSIAPLVNKINALEPSIKALNNEQLKSKTNEFKERLSRGETLDSLLPEAFAVVREAAFRVLGQRHYDVQLIGGTVLHRGKIAEMRTGEGKTLVATLPSYLNALTGKGVHVVTVNDYLAKRDAEWMGRVHNFLGLSVGVIVHGLSDYERKKSYACDITYGTNSEFGFDYLRDNMKFDLEDYVQRELHFAIVDEVDSILIDEARTPLIISGPTEDKTDLYYTIDKIIPKLDPKTDYTIDEKAKNASLTEAGIARVEKLLNVGNLYDPSNIEIVHHVNQALKAHVIFKRDVDYVVRDNQVIIVDEFTGRLMPGRRWSDGLHQAVEAKEGVEIENENQTLATITYQNYFRMYQKLSGMTGTADTEAEEFKKIYNLDVVVIPTNKPIRRIDHPDVIYKSQVGKHKAIIEQIKALYEKGQPVLVGTISIEKSEILSELLRRTGIPHNVLNAKQHEREAEIVAQAGRYKAVTISTNMAGRGTDILLGGNPEFLAKSEYIKKYGPNTPIEEHLDEYKELLEKFKAQCEKEREKVIELGGLFILGTERHESRRIDNQLRGRAGRQGDPGESRFYLSLEDDLMRIFGSVNIARFMEEDMPIEHKWITKAIANAQKKVESHNFDIRKHLLEYDDVMNQQRKVVYSLRKEILSGNKTKDIVLSFIDQLAAQLTLNVFPKKKLSSFAESEQKEILNEINQGLQNTFHIDLNLKLEDILNINKAQDFTNLIVNLVESKYNEKEKNVSEPIMRHLEKVILLTTIDHLWKDHLLAMDHLRDGIGLRGYGQKDPLLEYKKEGFNYFEMMFNAMMLDSVQKLFDVQIEREEQVNRMEEQMEREAQRQLAQAQISTSSSTTNSTQNSINQSNLSDSSIKKVGRNDPCPCGSGKKYKRCHGS